MDISRLLGSKRHKITLSPSNRRMVFSQRTVTEQLSEGVGSAQTGGGYQDYFRCLIELRKNGKPTVSYETGDVLSLKAELKYLLSGQSYPATVPMAFLLSIRIPTGDIIYGFPTARDNPDLRIYMPDPWGNDLKWPQLYGVDQELKVRHVDGSELKEMLIPLEMIENFPVGTYQVRLEAWYFDPLYVDPETNEQGLYALVSWDEKSFVFNPTPERQFKVEPFERVKINDHQRIESIDLDRMSKLPRKALSLALGLLLDGRSGVIDGLDLGIYEDANGRYVGIRGGTGVLFGEIDSIVGGHVMHIPSGEIVNAGYFSNYAPQSGQSRWDVICLGLDTVNEGEADGSIGDKRIFIHPGILEADGRPKRETKVVPTRNKYVVRSLWMTGGTEAEARAVQIPDGYIRIGFVVNSTDTAIQGVTSESFDPMTISQHREAVELDHPDRSVKTRHLETSLIGEGFQINRDLSLKTMSDEIKAARGRMLNLNERLEAIITEDGTIIEEPIIRMIDERLAAMLSGIVDAKGNLVEGVLTGSGLLTKAEATMGMVPDGGFVQLPFGYSQSQCIWMTAPARWGFTPGNASLPARRVDLVSDTTGLLVNVKSIVLCGDANNTVLTNPGIAQFLCIGFQKA